MKFLVLLTILFSIPAFADCGIRKAVGLDLSQEEAEKNPIDGVELLQVVLKAQPFKSCDNQELLFAGSYLWMVTQFKAEETDLPASLHALSKPAFDLAEGEIKSRGLEKDLSNP